MPVIFFYSLHAAIFLAVFYNTVTNMAGVYIASELGGSPEISVYLMVFYGLGNILSIPLTASLADRFGTIRLLSMALFGHAFFSLLCSTAPTFVVLNIYRFCLGFASGFFYITCRRLMLTYSPPEKLPFYSFITVLLFAVVPVLGVSFGAWNAYETHWRWIFLANQPIALLLAAYFWRYRSLDPQPTPLTLDKSGFFFYAIGISTLLIALTLSQQLDWYRSWVFLTLLIIGIPSLLFFLLRPTSLFEFQLFKAPTFSLALLSLAILFSTYFGMIILVSLWLNIYANYTPLWIAVLIGIMALAAIGAILASRTFLRHLDPRLTLILAILCLASSCYYSTFFDVDVDFFHLAVARSLAGIGLMLFLFPVFDLCFSVHGPEKGTAIFTLFQVVRVLGSSLGAGLYVILWQRRQVFFHERLGENITATSQLTAQYFQRATDIFHLTKGQATVQLTTLLEEQATSLALNDVFGCMGYILLALLALFLLHFFKNPKIFHS